LALGVSPTGRRVVVCQDGRILSSDETGHGPARLILKLDASRVAPITLAFSVPDGRRAVLGLASGGAVVIDLVEGRVVRTFERDSGALFDVALAGDRLALSDGRNKVYVLEVSTGALISQLNARRARVSWLDGGRRLRVVGRSVEDWSLPATPPWPHLHPGKAGVAALSLSPDGLHAASAHGDGRVRVWRLDRPAAVAEFLLHWSVVKDLEFSPDGRTIAIVCAQASHLFFIDLSGPPRLRSIPAHAGRRLAWLAGDLLLLATYRAGDRSGMLAWRHGQAEATPFDTGNISIYDMETDVDRKTATLRTSDGRVSRFHAATGRISDPFDAASSNGIAGHPARMALIHESELEIREANGSSRSVRLPGGFATDVAISPDGRWVAVGHIDGTVSIWSSVGLERRAVLRGHIGRVAAVAFDPSGDWLVSGSWDGDLRTWSMRSLEETPQALLEQARSAWGQSIEDVLDARTGSPD